MGQIFESPTVYSCQRMWVCSAVGEERNSCQLMQHDASVFPSETEFTCVLVENAEVFSLVPLELCRIFWQVNLNMFPDVEACVISKKVFFFLTQIKRLLNIWNSPFEKLKIKADACKLQSYKKKRDFFQILSYHSNYKVYFRDYMRQDTLCDVKLWSWRKIVHGFQIIF